MNVMARSAGAGVAEAGVEGDQAGLLPECGDVQGQLALGTLDDRQFDLPAIECQGRNPTHRLDPRGNARQFNYYGVIVRSPSWLENS